MNSKSPMNYYYSSGARPARPVTSDYGYGGSNNALDNKINSFDELQGIYLVRKPSRPVQAFATNSTAPICNAGLMSPVTIRAIRIVVPVARNRQVNPFKTLLNRDSWRAAVLSALSSLMRPKMLQLIHK